MVINADLKKEKTIVQKGCLVETAIKEFVVA